MILQLKIAAYVDDLFACAMCYMPHAIFLLMGCVVSCFVLCCVLLCMCCVRSWLTLCCVVLCCTYMWKLYRLLWPSLVTLQLKIVAYVGDLFACAMCYIYAICDTRYTLLKTTLGTISSPTSSSMSELQVEISKL